MTDRTTQYALDVVSGKRIAGELVILACRRHLDDIEKSKQADYLFYFDVKQANRIIAFAEELTIAEGEEPKAVHCYDFQCFILGSLNGWRKKKGGYRRFRSSYVQLARQNGKSLMNGILAAYYGNFDKYKYPQIYCTATKKEQAKIVFSEVQKFIQADAELEEHFKIMDYKSEIYCKDTRGKIEALSKDTKSIDGFRPYLGIVDEYHAHKSDQMYKQLEGGTKRLKSCLISVITTAGFNLKSPCYEMYEYCVQILKGAVENDSKFVYIAQLDEKDDLWNPENWLKANPSLVYDSEALENMKDPAKTAREMGGRTLRDFVVKQLNCWMQISDDVYLKDMDAWKAGETDLSLKDFTGSKTYVGLDLSSGGDLTSISFVIPYALEGVKKYFVDSHSFIPKKRVQEHIDSDRAPYDVWIKEGLITVTETMGGVKTDYKYILTYLQKIVEECGLDVQFICYDPHNASAFLQDLDDLGYDAISVTQSARYLNDATSDFRLEIESGNVTHPKNGMLTWSIANAKTVSNSFGEIKIDKEDHTERIDPVDATIDAWTSAMKGEVKTDINDSVEEWLQVYEQYTKKGGTRR